MDNPHVFVRAYVPNPAAEKKYDLYAFESGNIIGLARHGWRRDSFKPGDKVELKYFALRDGRNGGYFIRGVKSDGVVVGGDEAAALQLPGEKTAPAKLKE